jgi:ribonuclease HI
MAKAKQKFYVVWEGHMPGIYTSWDECKRQIDGYGTAKYKAFESRVEAELAIKRNYFEFVIKKSADISVSSSGSKRVKSTSIITDSISVDAACAGNPGLMEYQCVETISKKQIFHKGPYREGTNNIGEFLGLVHAIAMLQKLGNNHTAIYTDSKTAMAWVKHKKAKTTLELTNNNAELFDLISRAESWLKTNTFGNQIIKWETDDWGEIPADFGRK